METIFGSYYDESKYEDRLPDNTDLLRKSGIFVYGSSEANELSNSFKDRIAHGQKLYLVGLNLGHNSGVSLVEATAASGIRILANYEEERFSSVKHAAGYPEHSIRELGLYLKSLGRSANDIFCVAYAWNSVAEEKYGQKMHLLHAKIVRNKFFDHISDGATPTRQKEDATQGVRTRRNNLYTHSPSVVAAMERLTRDLQIPVRVPCVNLQHHDSHAYFSYGVSPFCKENGERTMVSCIDGGGDVSSSSLYVADGFALDVVKRISRENSLGVFYMLCSSFWGGWTALSAEGRYMGAAAWGDNSRLTNRYYMQMRQYFFFGPNGDVFVNSSMTDNAYALLQTIGGRFLDVKDLWNPDAILNVDDIKHSEVSQQRVDVAAAVQMVFEDALFHIINFLIRTTGSDQLVLCGGTALNCVANMRLLQSFDENYYSRVVGRRTRLNLWVPPIPSDQGVVVGAAYQFAMRNGVRPEGKLPTPFLCGLPPESKEIEQALTEAEYVHFDNLGNLHDNKRQAEIADFMAYVVSRNCIIGLFQGAAETGPRALGHRSILANPCNSNVMEVLNARVKLRERIRPLAPMMTVEEAEKWFELSPGAERDNYDAYNYMVLTTLAKEAAKSIIPAVIHRDGTSRIQIVRRENNSLVYDYLRALRKYIGVEVSVNTSLNVGSPIVQTPAQALQIFKRTKGLDGIFMVGKAGDVYMVWAKENVQEYPSRIPELVNAYFGADE
jgi:carbamoyltransferase